MFNGSGPKANDDEEHINSRKKVKVEKKKNPKQSKKKKFLDTFGTNLTNKAKNNELDIVIGKDSTANNIKIELKANEVAHLNGMKNWYFKEGVNELTPEQALAYSRIRYTAGGDYKRAERMRDVLNAGFDKIKTLSVGKLNNLANILLPKVYTNITSGDIIAMIPEVTQYNITASIGWPYEVKGITLDKWYGVPVTLESNVQKLHKELFGNDGYEVSSKVKEYSNGIIKKTGYK